MRWKLIRKVAIAMALAIGLAGGVAFAVHDLNLFELDGNAMDDPLVPGEDWSTLYAGGANNGGTALVFSTVITDGLNQSIFTTGGSKDDLDVSSWQWTDGSVPDKDDLLHAYAAIYRNPANNHNILYFGADRFANNGDSQIGFWFFQNAVGLNADGTFSGVHAVGDLLVLSDFTQGGGISTIKVYEWVGSGGSEGSLNLIYTGVDCANSPAGDLVCGEVNTAATPAPWPYTPKSGPSGSFPTGSFFEAGLDLTALIPDAACLSSFLAETRSSQSVTAQLKDFVLGGFDTCKIKVEKSGPELSKAGDTVTYTYTIKNEGIATLYLDSITDDPIGNLKNEALAADCGTLDPGAQCTFTVDYVVQATDPDPLVNTVTVVYNDNESLTGTEVTGTAEFSVNLFQPSIKLTKTGPTLAKAGDKVTYTVDIENTSSTDTPKLKLDSFEDTLVPGVTPPVACDELASGATCSFTYEYTVKVTDTAPLENTATAHYKPDGFTNDITASAKWSVDLFTPALKLTKTGPALSKVGDKVTYTVKIENTSSANSPSLVLDSFTDTLVSGVTPPAACSPLAPGASCSFTYDYTVKSGDPDPLLNTAAAHYKPEGFPNDISSSSSHSVNLFQPSLKLTKTGPALSKVGDKVTYTVKIENTSSADTPNLVLDSFADTLVPGATPPAACSPLASGANCSFTYDYTVKGTDTPPLNNTATAHYHPDGFTNDISSSSSHSVDLFTPALKLTKTGPALSKVSDSVTYNITIENTSSANTPNLVLDSFTDTLVAGVVPPAACSPLASGASCSFSYGYTVKVGDPDPLLNTATAHYHPTGFANDVWSSSSHSVNLFTPAIVFAKAANTQLSKVGDVVNYALTLENTSTADSPNLVCTITDAMLGVNKQVTLVSGASDVTNVAYTVPQGAADPLVNTANVSCSPVGFSNVLQASSSWTVDLFQPALKITKTGPTYSKAGDTATYNVTIQNMSSLDSPSLVLLSFTDTLVAGVTPPAACSPLAPGASCSFSYDYVVQSGDPDPLLNTATVHYYPLGFSNDVNGSSSHSTDLVHPSYTLTTTCVNNPVPAGASANFRINLENTGDVPLIVHVIDTVLGLDMPDIELAVKTAPCDPEVNSPGCVVIEASIIATGTEIVNVATATATLPPSYNLPNVVEPTGGAAICMTEVTGGATRTPGFWQTHYDYTSHVFTVHLGGDINLGWKNLTSVGDVFGMFWANTARDSQNKKRDPLCQARVIASFQALAAILNSGLSNGAPLPVSLAVIQATLAGTDIAAIQALGALLGNYNSTTGETVAIVDNDGYAILHANPKAAKQAANTSIADCGP